VVGGQLRGVVGQHLDGTGDQPRHLQVARARQRRGEVGGGHEHPGILGAQHQGILRHVMRGDHGRPIRGRGRVEQQGEGVLAVARHGHLRHQVALRGEHQRARGAAHGQCLDVGGEQAVKQGRRVGALHPRDAPGDDGRDGGGHGRATLPFVRARAAAMRSRSAPSRAAARMSRTIDRRTSSSRHSSRSCLGSAGISIIPARA